MSLLVIMWVEIGVDSVAGVRAAAAAGADRVELCAAPVDGGLTPGRGWSRRPWRWPAGPRCTCSSGPGRGTMRHRELPVEASSSTRSRSSPSDAASASVRIWAVSSAFRYPAEEIAVMSRDIAVARECGAAGVVVGALDDRGEITGPFVEAAEC